MQFREKKVCQERADEIGRSQVDHEPKGAPLEYTAKCLKTASFQGLGLPKAACFFQAWGQGQPYERSGREG